MSRCTTEVAAWLAFLTVLAPSAASAQASGGELPPDVTGWHADAPERPPLPAPPEGFATERIGEVRWDYPEAAADEAAALQDVYDDAWARIEDDLGVEVERELVLRIAPGPEQMRALAPEGHPPPEYAVGVAYPAWGVILLTLSAPQTWERPPLEKVLTHELSHVALRRAVRGRELPQWFVEGVAIHQASEYSLARIRTLWEATVQDELLPLSRLSAGFPARSGEVSVAYAQSADVVRHLREDDVAARRFRQLIEHLREGEGFDQALMDSYFLSPERLEREWKADVNERYQALPLVLGGSGVWVLAALFMLVAWVRRRRKHKRKLAEWAEQEEAIDRAETAVDEHSAIDDPFAGADVNASVTASARAAPDVNVDVEAHTADVEHAELVMPTVPTGEGAHERIVVYVSGEPPGGREPDVPTVEYEGRSHTLH